jgi:hypothetical protein
MESESLSRSWLHLYEEFYGLVVTLMDLGRAF